MGAHGWVSSTVGMQTHPSTRTMASSSSSTRPGEAAGPPSALPLLSQTIHQVTSPATEPTPSARGRAVTYHSREAAQLQPNRKSSLENTAQGPELGQAGDLALGTSYWQAPEHQFLPFPPASCRGAQVASLTQQLLRRSHENPPQPLQPPGEDKTMQVTIRLGRDGSTHQRAAQAARAHQRSSPTEFIFSRGSRLFLVPLKKPMELRVGRCLVWERYSCTASFWWPTPTAGIASATAGRGQG